MPDLIIHNLNKKYNGLVLELKSPSSYGILSEDQKSVLNEFKHNNFKVIVSNDYDLIIENILSYFQNTGIKCLICKNVFKDNDELYKHSHDTVM